MKARWTRRMLWLAGFACLWLPVLDDPPLRTGAYLQDVTTSAVTVAMITADPTQLECIVRDAAGNVVATVAGPTGRRRHALRITGLRPATEYAYELRAVGAAAMDAGRLRTAPDEDRAPVRFVFLGDSGDPPWWVWLQTAPALYLPSAWGWLPTSAPVTGVGAAVAAYAPDFVLHLGDVVYPRGMHAHYASAFFRPFAEVMRHAPVYAVLGNHDDMDVGGLQLLGNLRMPTGDTTGDSRCYSFAWGAVRVIALDLNADYGAGEVQPGHPSLDFLLAELGRCTEPWIVVASHFPARSASRSRGRRDLMVTMLPVLDEMGVDLYLSGHDHCYQRFGGDGAGGVPLVVSGGGGKDLYAVRPDPFAAVLQSQYHWCSAETVGGILRIRAHGLDGGLIDTLEIGLATGDELTRLRQRNPARAARIDALRGH